MMEFEGAPSLRRTNALMPASPTIPLFHSVGKPCGFYERLRHLAMLVVMRRAANPITSSLYLRYRVRPYFFVYGHKALNELKFLFE
jgi:hypothetical protein